MPNVKECNSLSTDKFRNPKNIPTPANLKRLNFPSLLSHTAWTPSITDYSQTADYLCDYAYF